jgi:hypothetical protein
LQSPYPLHLQHGHQLPKSDFTLQLCESIATDTAEDGMAKKKGKEAAKLRSKVIFAHVYMPLSMHLIFILSKLAEHGHAVGTVFKFADFFLKAAGRFFPQAG